MAGRKPKASTARGRGALLFWQEVTFAALRQMPVDLSARQTAVLLCVHLSEVPPSVKSLAETLGISKPAICRALDTLEKAKLVKRMQDKKDRRSVWIRRTARGEAFLTDMAGILISCSRDAA